MSTIEQPPKIENKEIIPSEKEILDVFKKLLNEKEDENVRKLEVRKLKEGDEIYLWEIKFFENENGFSQYEYNRKGSYPGRDAGETAIYVVHYNKEGEPYGGNDVAKFINGKWEITK